MDVLQMGSTKIRLADVKYDVQSTCDVYVQSGGNSMGKNILIKKTIYDYD